MQSPGLSPAASAGLPATTLVTWSQCSARRYWSSKPNSTLIPERWEYIDTPLYRTVAAAKRIASTASNGFGNDDASAMSLRTTTTSRESVRQPADAQGPQLLSSATADRICSRSTTSRRPLPEPGSSGDPTVILAK